MFTLIYSNAQISGLRAKCIAPNRNKLSRRNAECRAVRGCVVRTTGTDVWTIKYPMADTAGGRSRQNDLSLSRRYALCSSLHLPEVMHSELELMRRWKATRLFSQLLRRNGTLCGLSAFYAVYAFVRSPFSFPLNLCESLRGHLGVFINKGRVSYVSDGPLIINECFVRFFSLVCFTLLPEC